MKEELTCELNGIKYLKFSATLAMKEKHLKSYDRHISIHGGIVICVSHKRTGSFLFPIDLCIVDYLIPESRVLEFNKCKWMP